MRVLITSRGELLSDTVESYFGRAKYLLIVDDDCDHHCAYENVQNTGLSQGAGIQTASRALTLGAEVIITGQIGPKALQVLQAANIAIYLASGQSSVTEAIKLFSQGRLKKLASADSN